MSIAEDRPLRASTLIRKEPNAIWDAYLRSRDAGPQLWFRDGRQYRAYTWDDWRGGAERAAARLRELGVEPGARVAAVLTNCFEACTALVGAWLAGATMVSLPTMRRGMEADAYVQQLKRLCGAVDAAVMLIEDRFVDLLADGAVGVPVHSFASLDSDGAIEPDPPADDAPAFIQFSSGSTSDPKGCVLSMGAISHQERLLATRLNAGRHSRGVTWLPFSHDMGLFGTLLLSWTSGMRLAVSTPERFLRKPQTWLEDCVELGATITAAPNFALGLAARKAGRIAATGRCPMQTVVLGGERVEWGTLAMADEALGPFGLTLDTLAPAYGLAEATLAVSAKRVNEVPRSISIDRESAYRGILARRPDDDPAAMRVVSCGSPLPGVSVRIVDGEVGRIAVRTPSRADCYLDRPDASARSFVDGELITQDLGFVVDGELYVIARIDDVIPVGGRNVHARDVELALDRCAGVRPGCSALIEIRRNSESALALAVEPAAPDADLAVLARDVARSAYRNSGVRVAECAIVKPGALPKTPSGKIQRFRAAQLVERGADVILERVAL